MTQTLQTEETFRVTVTAAPPAATLMILSIVGELGIEPGQTAERLAHLPAVLTDAVPYAQARRLSLLLSLFGVNVRLDPALSLPADPAGAATDCDRVDLSVQLAEGADRAASVARLTRVLGADADLSPLDLPGGMVLRGLATADRLRILRALKRHSGLRVAVSDQEGAVFDLFAPRTPQTWAEARRLGLTRCRFSGAAVGGMNLATARALMARLGPGALLVDRAFQRFDLRLRAARGPDAGEVAAFLETRPGADRAALRSGTLPRVETDLTRAAAARFVADYAEIGLDVVPVLRGSMPENR